MYRKLIILLFFTCNSFAQDFSGSWILSSVDVFGVKGNGPEHDAVIEQKREIYEEEYKGKFIYEFMRNGIVFTHFVKNSDTILVAESEWRKRKNSITKKDLNAPQSSADLFQLTENGYCQTKTMEIESVTIAIKLSYSKLDFISRPKHNREQIDDYFKAGVPSLFKIWGFEDYTDAALVIYDLYENKKMNLPHHSDSTYKILEKLTDLKTLQLLFKSEKEDYLGLYHLYRLSNALLKVGGAYETGKDGSLAYSKEYVMIFKAMLLLIDRINELSNNEEIKPKLNLQQQSNAVLYQNEVMKAYIASGFLVLQEGRQFRITDVCDFRNYFINFCKKNYDYIPNDMKNGFDKTIEEIKRRYHLNCQSD